MNLINKNPDKTAVICRTSIIITIMLVIALVHTLRLGTYLNEPLFSLYYSYFSDIVIPFGMYFLLSLNDVSLPFMRDWRVKALLVFAAASFTELLQAFGVPLLGETFDPLDMVMFAIGVFLAVFMDQVIFGRLLPFWLPVQKSQVPPKL